MQGITLSEFLWLAAGCAAGGMLRFWLSGLIGSRMGQRFPWGTLGVNVSGSFLVGLSVMLMAGYGWLADSRIWLFLIIGLLGSYTTVSSFSFQTLSLLQQRETKLAATYVAGSLGLCLAAASLGLLAGSQLIELVFARQEFR